MIPLPFTEHHETTPEFPECGRRGWRWVIDAGRWQRGVYISLDQQVIFHEHTDGWHNGNRYITLSLVRQFEVGEAHDYYDGPHCCIKLGWLRINYSWNWCKKCMPDEP
jgi:hypothetical protein